MSEKGALNQDIPEPIPEVSSPRSISETDLFVPDHARKYLGDTTTGWLTSVPAISRTVLVDPVYFWFFVSLTLIALVSTSYGLWRRRLKRLLRDEAAAKPKGFVPQSKEIKLESDFNVLGASPSPASNVSRPTSMTEDQQLQLSSMLSQAGKSLAEINGMSEGQLPSDDTNSQTTTALDHLFEENDSLKMEKTLHGEYESTHLVVNGDLIFSTEDFIDSSKLRDGSDKESGSSSE